ncbi:AAA family ATPase [Leekyejoonella antrihumi]|uniref:Chromosome partitioning protein n=1 Tax=Leekyejoonella antrihumi TaxID=1660198 RepID=A0A563DYS4_9MICO|nr:chromosome partitioning protein [Leekyejoonella antrihumi]TWP35113.1 chromosome partitioning protein [Leekyejoonella antrihumi]
MSVIVVTGVVALADAQIARALGQAAGVRLARRCPDLADVLSVVEAGRADAVVLSADLPGLDRSAIARIRAAGAAIVGLYAPGDERAQRVLLQWGVAACLPDSASADDLRQAVQSEAAGATPEERADADEAAGASRLPAALDDEPAEPEGRIVTVWGPVGAPGRTTVAVNLAVELALSGVRSLLIDADTYGASVAQYVALLDEAPGIAAATRLADAGHLDLHTLASAAPEVVPGMRVLTGLPRADRWPELREAAFEEVLVQSRRLAQVTVIDVSAPLEDDEELSYDTLAPRRNAITLAALRAASTVLAVGSADPIGLQRLVRGLEELRPRIEATPRVVVTKVRASAVGATPEHKVAEALERFAGVDDVTIIPDDRDALDRALLSGRLLAESAPNSPIREALAKLGADLGGVDFPSRRGRRTWRRMVGGSP